MRPPQRFELTEDEQQLIKFADESEQFVILPMWKRIEQKLNEWVEEALDEIRGNISTDGLVALHKQRIWKEREHLRDSLITFVKGPIKRRTDLMEEIETLRKEGHLI